MVVTKLEELIYTASAEDHKFSTVQRKNRYRESVKIFVCIKKCGSVFQEHICFNCIIDAGKRVTEKFDYTFKTPRVNRMVLSMTSTMPHILC